MKEEVLVEETPLGIVAPSGLRRASWGAVFAGMFFTTVLQIMFTLLGMAVGFGPLRPSHQANPGQAMAMGSGIWLLVTGLVSIWIGACVAGRLSGGPRRADGMLHGLITWSVSVVVAFGLLATTIGTVVGGTAALVNGAVASLGGASAEGQDVVASLGQDVRSVLPQAAALLPPTGRTEGQQVPERFQQANGQASQDLHQTGQVVANGLSQGAFWGFLALFLGLLVAAWGGWAGTATLPRPT